MIARETWLYFTDPETGLQLHGRLLGLVTRVRDKPRPSGQGRIAQRPEGARLPRPER